MSNTIDNITVQGIGGWVDGINQMRIEKYIENIRIQDINFENAINELNLARGFLGSPEHILGSYATKHGEVAEVFDVRFRNADRLIRGEEPNYTFDGVGRTAPEDYLNNNLPVQSKFVQSNLSMDAVLGHLDKYPDFVQNGGTYSIPKDFYEQIEAWMKLSPKELSNLPASEGGRLARNVVERIHELEAKTDKNFSELISPSQVDYDQVQLNHAGDTIDGKEQEIIDVDGEKREEYWRMSRASIEEGLRAAGIAAAISAVLSFTTTLISILKGKKKKLSELTKEDWQQIFKKTSIGAFKGGVSGGAIYTLTNVAGISAPLAAAIVSATLGVATQAIKLYKNEITFDDFMCNILGVATEASVSAIGAFAGQMIIPVPGLGAIVGSIVATSILNIVKKHIFGGGFYELVKQAHAEKQFSDEYKPLLLAFERATSEWKRIDYDISNILRPYITQSEDAFCEKIGDLHNYIERI